MHFLSSSFLKSRLKSLFVMGMSGHFLVYGCLDQIQPINPSLFEVDKEVSPPFSSVDVGSSNSSPAPLILGRASQ